MDGLLAEFHKRNFTTFLVTNGLASSNLEALSVEPTQLYISLDAPDRKPMRNSADPRYLTHGIFSTGPLRSCHPLTAGRFCA